MERSSELRRTLIVLFAGVIAAFLVAAFFIMFYGTSGKYTAQTVLLEPSLLPKLDYNDLNPRISSNDRYVFDHLTLTNPRKTPSKQIIDINTYARLYNLIEGDTSISPSLEIEQLFQRGPAAVLGIWVHTESASAWQKDAKIFQEVQFADQGDYYRVELHEQEKGIHWVYFYHPNILNQL